jgi:hypothetical protein
MKSIKKYIPMAKSIVLAGLFSGVALYCTWVVWNLAVLVFTK